VVELACLTYGVGHEDEGVCLLIQMGPHRILLDCGIDKIDPLRQRGRGQRGDATRLSKGEVGRSLPADLLLCTHGHPDHARGLLALHQAFPQMPIYATEVTSQLLRLNWLDQPDVPQFCQALPWRTPVEFREGLSAELYPAGHLPGAAALLLTYTTPQRPYTLFYTGDFFLSNSRLVDGMPLEELRGLKPDVLILEGSYGTARYPHRRQQENQLAERINRAIASQQSVLLPTPTLGLGQELLMMLRSHHYFTGRDIDIWVDGSVAIGCDAYLELLPHFPSAVQNFARHQPLFWDERIRPRVRRLTPELKRNGKSMLRDGAPVIVITDKDADFSEYCSPDTGDWLLLVPHQPGRLGSVEVAVERAVQQSEELRSLLQSKQLVIDTYFLGDHCDGPGTTQLIHNLRPQHVVFIHGSPSYLSDLASLEELQNRYHLHMPAADSVVELPIGETFLQPAAPEARYEGELTELEHGVMIVLPEAIASDSRWQNFADTGLLEARWQGEDLVLRGLPQRELLNQSHEDTNLDLECCENCRHYRGQRCWNQASPLFGFKVTPEGYCPVFEPALEALDDITAEGEEG
jgi:Cft2 family RNA processing exonuclease